MDYLEARKFLQSVSKIGITLGLENIKNLLQQLGNPQDNLKFVHIAGTNGKGSTLAYISTITEIAGYKTGRYITPAVSDEREIIQINRTNITKKDFAKQMTKIKKAIEKMCQKKMPHPSTFEIETALAFLHFSANNCDIVIMETGMGGKTDATNIIKKPLACVFTTVSRDHMEFLGNTIAELTYAKAGIIKKGAAVIYGKLPKEAEKIIKATAQPTKNKLHFANPTNITIETPQLPFTQKFSYKGLKNITIHLLGAHQVANAALAIETVSSLKAHDFDITDEHILAGLEATRWFGRLSIMQSENPVVIVDGAHNEESALVLANTLESLFPDSLIIGVMGVFKDKEVAQILTAVKPVMNRLYTVALKDKSRTVSAAVLAKFATEVGIDAKSYLSFDKAIDDALEIADVVVVFGSLSHLSDASKHLKS